MLNKTDRRKYPPCFLFLKLCISQSIYLPFSLVQFAHIRLFTHPLDSFFFSSSWYLFFALYSYILIFQLSWTSPYVCIYIYIQMYVYSGSVFFLHCLCVCAWIDLDFYFPRSWWFHSICVKCISLKNLNYYISHLTLVVCETEQHWYILESFFFVFLLVVSCACRVAHIFLWNPFLLSD